MPPIRFRRAGALAASISLLLTVIACSGQEPDEPNGSSGSTTGQEGASLPPRIDADWSVPMAAKDSREVRSLDHWSSARRVILVDGRRLRALDPRDGSEQWSMALPKGSTICESSRELNQDEIGAITLAVGGEENCTLATVIDTVTGRQLWEKRMPRGFVDLGEVSLTPSRKVLTLHGRCGQALQFDIRSGKPVRTLAKTDRVCGNSSSSRGEFVLLYLDRESAATPDDHGTGWIPPYDGAAAIELRRADTNALVWRKVVPRRGTDALDIVSVDPMVLLLERDQVTSMYRFDDAGKTMKTIGRPLGAGIQRSEMRVVGKALIGSLERPSAFATSVRSLDLETGRENWHKELAAGAVDGVQGQDLLSALPYSYPDAPEGETWLVRQSVRDPDDVRPVGRIQGFATSSTFADDRLLTFNGGKITAYSVGDGASSYAQFPEGTRLAPTTNFLAGPADDACAAIRPQLLRAIGFEHPRAPYDCHWREEDASLVDRDLAADVVEHADASGAERYVTTLAESNPDSPSPRLRGFSETWGNTSKAYVGTQHGSSNQTAQTRIVVASGRFTVDLRLNVDDGVQTGAPPPSFALETAGMEAVSQVLEFLGEDPGSVPAPQGGPVRRAPDVCRLLGSDLQRLFPGTTKNTSWQPEGRMLRNWSGADTDRQAACLRRSPNDGDPSIEILATAQPNDILGRSGTEIARREMRTFLRRAAVTPLRDVGQEAAVDTFTYSSGEYVAHGVAARRGNLLVWVHYSDEGFPDSAAMLTEAKALARRVLRSAG